MKKSEIKVGGRYTAKVNGRLTTVRVDVVREYEGFRGALSGRRVRSETTYDVTNLETGRTTTFRSAAKFRAEVPPTTVKAGVLKGAELAFLRETGKEIVVTPAELEQRTIIVGGSPVGGGAIGVDTRDDKEVTT